MSAPANGSWGRYPYITQQAHHLEWPQDVDKLVQKFAREGKQFLPYGNGRSYGDSCLSASNHIIAMRALNRFISFDKSSGILRAEAGVTFEEILRVIIPHGWFLPVTPGTKFITLGGAIGNDVHGKNHHTKGTFGRHVIKFGIHRSDSSTEICSPAQNPALFAATIGGLGLTGIILWAEIQLMPITSSTIDTTTLCFNNIEEFIDLSNEYDYKNEYSVAWIDCTATKKHLGRGIFVTGNHSVDKKLIAHDGNYKNFPIEPPFSLINKITLKLFNEFYYQSHKYKKRHDNIEYDPFFYPLDGIHHWNKIYGPKGFQQYQCVIPTTNAVVAIKNILTIISASKSGSFLAVLKRCGNVPSPGLLSFPLPGISLAIDFSQSSYITEFLFPLLDRIVTDNGGRLYPAKDAHMSAKDFQSYYPEWKTLESLRDPGIKSYFWERVTRL